MSHRELHLNRRDWEARVIFEDAHLIAVDKPSGVLSVPDRWDRKRANVLDALRALRPGYLANAHRLDAGTSGLLVFARTRAALPSLVRQFRDRSVRKTYFALATGSMPGPFMRVDQPIAPDTRHPGCSVARASGRPAITEFEEIERFREHAWVKATPFTGRLHQIRVHLRHIGCPIACDTTYGDGAPLLLSRFKSGYKSAAPERPLLDRLALHAGVLELAHPETGVPLRIEAPLPADLSVALKQLRKYALAPRAGPG